MRSIEEPVLEQQGINAIGNCCRRGRPGDADFLSIVEDVQDCALESTAVVSSGPEGLGKDTQRMK